MTIEAGLNKFIESINQGYAYNDELRKIARVSESELDTEYVQIANRIKMAYTDFAPDVDTSHLGFDIGRGVSIGEKNSLVKNIKLKYTENIDVISNVNDLEKLLISEVHGDSGYDTLLADVRSIGTVFYLLRPLYRKETREKYIDIQGKQLNIFTYHSNDEKKEFVLFNSRETLFARKEMQRMVIPSLLKNYEEKNPNQNHKLSIRVGSFRENNKMWFDVYVRSVVGFKIMSKLKIFTMNDDIDG